MSHDSPHPPGHEDRLVSAYSDTSEGRPTLPQDLSDCPDCRRQWTAMHTLDARLKNTRREMEMDLAQAEALRDAPGTERVAEAVEIARQRKLAPRTGPRRSRPMWFVLAAAGLVAAVWVAGRLSSPSRTKPDVQLGTTTLELLTPVDRVEEFRVFAWRYTPGPNESARLRVWTRDATSGARRVLESVDDIRDSSVELPLEKTRPWPDEISWSVTIVDSTNAPTGRTGEASAVRRAAR